MPCGTGRGHGPVRAHPAYTRRAPWQNAAMPLATDPQSEFARAVYAAVAAVPAGRVASYGDIARQAGFPRHARFVGRLLSKLPADSALPWWRILRSDGVIALSDEDAERQRERLAAEGVPVKNGRTDLGRFRCTP